MKHIVICDDDLAFAQSLSDSVRRFFGDRCEIALFQSAEALRFARPDLQPDIALLDIRLDTESGIALARELFPARTGTVVIFITGYVEYCTDVYEAEHIYFLLKPIRPEQLEHALEKALKALEAAPCAFSVRTGGEIRRILLSEVLYIETFYRKLRICMADETVELYGSIASLPDEVKARLIHCHKSYLVNPEHVRAMQADSFLMDNGAAVPISHSNRAKSRTQFLDCLAEQLEAK